ncbi:MAG: hypothetical protein K2P88_02690 [Chitinophagaceae bacterium]|uniref:hypothetical protein n=1 Tax=unclassified Paraflavitalea TaxID=2798305 RepID=UPI003D33C6B7|nr:hypothetical protein [Chitinophagaceae bacterium]
MKLKMLIAFALIAIVSIGTAEAHGIGKRAQKARIAQGIRNGSINKREARLLMHEQRSIQRQRRHFRANDGRIGPRERRILRHERRAANRHIFRAKHNGR